MSDWSAPLVDDWKPSVRLATVNALPAYTALSTTRLQANLNGAFGNMDGIPVVLNNRVLVKDEVGALAPNNGLYRFTQVGDGANPWILDRTDDMSQTGDSFTCGATVWVEEGAVNLRTFFTLITPSPITPGGTALMWQIGPQPWDADLTAIAALATTGFIVRTGAGTAATRNVTGTANHTTVINPDGVAGNTVLSNPELAEAAELALAGW